MIYARCADFSVDFPPSMRYNLVCKEVRTWKIDCVPYKIRMK